MPLDELLPKAIRLYPEKEAVVCGKIRMDYRGFGRRVWRLSQGLIGLGLKRNDRVAILHENSHEFLEAYFATAHLGAILVPLNFRLSPKELSMILNDSESRILISQGAFRGKINDILRSAPTIEKVIWTQADFEPSGSKEIAYESFLSGQKESRHPVSQSRTTMWPNYTIPVEQPDVRRA